MGRFFIILVVGLALCTFIGWWFDLFITEPNLPETQAAEKKYPFEGTLYDKAPYPVIKQETQTVSLDPIVVSAHLSVTDKIDVSSRIEGKLMFVGEQIPDGAEIVCGVAPLMAEPIEFATYSKGGDEAVMFYRKWKEGSVVKQDQMVAMLHPSRALNEMAAKAANVLVANSKYRASFATYKEASAQLDRKEVLARQGVISAEELGLARLTKQKTKEEWNSAREAVKNALIEEQSARLVYKMHIIKNELPASRSKFKMIFRNRGESVKGSEPFLQLMSIDRLMARGMANVQYLRPGPDGKPRLREGMTVSIEPTVQVAPVRERDLAHKDEVTCVTVTAKSKLIVSGSLDKTVQVWHRNKAGALFILPHPDIVRSVAASPLGDICAVGCADGGIWIYDLEKPEGERKLKHIQDAHREGVTSLAFSPDGQFLASGGGDNDITIWNAEDGEKIYTFDEAHGVDKPHRGTITSLHFTPQCRLVSASRDKTIGVWDLHENGPELVDDEPIIGRGGSVTDLGVSKDGRWMLFDKGKTLQMLSLKDRRALNTIQDPSGAIPFETLAIFSPDSSLLLTAGAPEGRMQLWRVPEVGGRAYEVRQLSPVQSSPVTCAAFAPDGSFAISGTKSGYVHIWELPSRQEVENHQIRGLRVSMIDSALESSSNQVHLSVMVPNPINDENPNGRLIPGQAVTIVVEPEKQLQ